MLASALSVLSLAALLIPSVSAENHTVIVGGTAGLVFEPANVAAAVGDFVIYEFHSKNHTVTQSTFADPCSLLMNATSGAVGFDSGFVPSPADATEFKTMVIEVKVDTPLWYYCKQGPHCSLGMVGAINAKEDGDKSFSAFKAKAMATAAAPAGGASSATPAGGASSAASGPGGATASVAASATAPIASASGRTPTTGGNGLSSAAAASSSVGAGGTVAGGSTTTSGARSSRSAAFALAALVPAAMAFLF